MVVQNLIDLATEELGYLEKSRAAYIADPDVVWEKTAGAGKDNFTKYATVVDKTKINNGPKQGYAWCAIFVQYCFLQLTGSEDLARQVLRIPITKSLAAGVDYFKNYFKSAGALFNKPQVGDIVFFGTQHTGLVIACNDTYMTTIEGNTSNASGVVSNGGGVAQKGYYIGSSNNYTYGRPNWDLIGGYDYVVPIEGGDIEVNLRTLSKGCKGDDVKALQALLWGYSYNVGSIDGDYGQKTYNAVKLYQANHTKSGPADGICGEKTWRSLLGI